MNKPKLLRERVRKDKYYNAFSVFECPYCGIEFEATIANVNQGHHKSCGCMRGKLVTKANTTHDMSKTVLYNKWAMMKKLVHKSHKMRRSFYDKGITICDEWSKFSKFMEWSMNNGYKGNLTLGRKDRSGNFSPKNCYWATLAVIVQNKASRLNTNQVIVIKERLKNNERVSSITKDYNVSYSSINSIKLGRTWRNI